MQAQLQALDLRKDFPRSPNMSLGGYVILPRIIDKCRAFIAGTNGEYNYNCPLDQLFFNFVKVDAEAFKQQVAAGKSDEEMLAWVQANAAEKHDEAAILTWSYQQRWRRPEGEIIAYFETLRKSVAPENYQIETWFQLLDADERRF